MSRIEESSHSKILPSKTKSPPITPKADSVTKPAPDFKLDISTKSKELAKDLEKSTKEKEQIADSKKEAVPTAEVEKIPLALKERKSLDYPGVFFISGFDWLGASSVKGNYDGIRDMAMAVDDGQHFNWDQHDDIIQKIKKHDSNQPIVLVGHSFGGDAAVEIANTLNTAENNFRKIDLLVTLDSVGLNNDLIPQNVAKNLNYIADDNMFINDGPNLARNYERTSVENFLRPEAHAELDDTIDIQMRIMDEIDSLTWKS